MSSSSICCCLWFLFYLPKLRSLMICWCRLLRSYFMYAKIMIAKSPTHIRTVSNPPFITQLYILFSPRYQFAINYNRYCSIHQNKNTTNKIFMKSNETQSDHLTHNFMKYKTLKPHTYIRIYKHQQPPVKTFKNTLYRYIKKDYDFSNSNSHQSLRNSVLRKQEQQRQTTMETNSRLKSQSRASSYQPKKRKNIERCYTDVIDHMNKKTNDLSKQNDHVNERSKSLFQSNTNNFMREQQRRVQQIKQIKQKSNVIFCSLQSIYASMKNSRERLQILSKFNRLTTSYLKNTPENFEEQSRETLQANKFFMQDCLSGVENPLKIMNGSIKKNRELNELAEGVKVFEEPVISKQLKDHYLAKRNKIRDRNGKNMQKRLQYET